MKKENQIEVLNVVPAGKDEMNLAEFPIALLTDKGKAVKTLQFTDTISGKDSKPVIRKWTLTASDKFGMPTRDDEKIYVALMQITKENGFNSPQQFFTRYRVLKTIGWPTNVGIYYKRVENALDKFMGITIKAENAFYDIRKRAYVTQAFHIIDNYKLWDRGEGFGGGQKALPLSNFKWNEVIWTSMQNGYIKNLDTKFWFSLRSSIARRLHRYLDKKFYHRHVFKIQLKKLAFEKLGMSRTYKKPTKIKSLLNPAFEELIERGYLKSYAYDKSNQREEIVIFVRSEKGRQVEIPLSEIQTDLLNQLIDRGISKGTASQLLNEYSRERIIQKIELHDYLKSINSHLLGKNPAGYLRKAIEEDYTPPQGFTTRAEREEANRIEEKTKQLERDQKEKEFQKWLNTPDEEKIRGKLSFWQQKFKMRHRIEPTIQQIEVKKQELISQLPTPEQKRQQIFGGT